MSKKPASVDETFSKKSVVEKKNRYKDRFPCELKWICLHIVAMETKCFVNTKFNVNTIDQLD